MPPERVNLRSLTNVLPNSNPLGAGGNQNDSRKAAEEDDAADSIEDADDDMDVLPEPDLDAFVPIYTGRHVWSATRSDPLVPFEDLPLPKTDRAKLPPCTIRWQFTGQFVPARDSGPALGSLRKQLRDHMASRGVKDVQCMVNFPQGTGRGKMVDISVMQKHLTIASEATLVFRQAKLQRLFVGPALDFNFFAIEIQNLPYTAAYSGTARLLWAALRPFVQVHDIWVRQVSYASDGMPPQDENVYLALVSVPKDDDNHIDPSLLAAIPGFIKIRDDELPLSFAGRLDWCTTCKSRAEHFHTFETCPKRQCNKCRKFGHLSANCKSSSPPDAGGDAAAAAQQAREAAAGDLNYGA